MQNHAMVQFFHWNYPVDKKLWKEVASEAKNLSELGFGGVWLPPACKPTDKNSVGYDAYDLYDLGEFDQKGTVETRYGSKDDYLEAINSLHANGVQAYADVILNHKAGADETEVVKAYKVDPEDRTKRISKTYTIHAYTKFTFPGRNNKYSAFKWNHHHFTGVDWDEKQKEKAIFKLINRYTTWEDVLSTEKSNFDYLMFSDIELRNKQVRRELYNWGHWYLETTGVDGFRLDAVKHMNTKFFKKWLDKLRKATGKEVFAVGEYAGSLDVLLKYIHQTKGCMSLFDFPLHKRFYTASQKGKDFDLRRLTEETLVSNVPSHSVTFLDNHDTQWLREREAMVESWFRPLAYAFILLREGGYPCVFYPDLYGASYEGKGKDGNTVQINIEPCKNLKELLQLRKDKAYGPQRDFSNDQHIIGWTREGVDEKPGSGCAVLINNFEKGQLEMELGPRHAGKTFYAHVGEIDEKVTLDENGKGLFRVNAGSVAAWVSEN